MLLIWVERCLRCMTTENSIMILFPYKYNGTWVFDDVDRGLIKEPFVAGIDKILDKLTQYIPDADKGFKLLFSESYLPKADVKLVWMRKEGGGNWYKAPTLGMEGWLCPALYKYFKEAPNQIYIKIEI